MKTSKKPIFKTIFLLLIIIILIITFKNAYEISQKDVDLKSLYSQVEKISYEDPLKVNERAKDIYFARPYGYDFDKANGIFLTNQSATIEILPDVISADDIGENYTINENEERIFEGTNKNDQSITQDFINMYVWEADNYFEILLIDENKNTVIGDLDKGYVEKGVTDMALILNSIKDA